MYKRQVRELVNVDDLKKDLAINKAIDFIKSQMCIRDRGYAEPAPVRVRPASLHRPATRFAQPGITYRLMK